MTIAEIIAIALSIVSAVGALIAALAKSRTEAAAQIVTGYGQLCDDLQAQIRANNDEITKLRGDLAEERRLRTEMRAELEALREERAEWQRERAELIKRIEDLESENRLLKNKIELMQKEYCVGG